MKLACKLIITLLLAASHSQAASPHRSEAPVKWQEITLGPPGATYRFPVYANLPLAGDIHGVRRVIIIQHGLARNGDTYFLTADNLMRRSGIDGQQTLLIAPQFFATPDARKLDLSGLPVWSIEGWMAGEDSNGGPLAVSSFRVYDDLLTWLSDRQRLPALTRIVIAGHSGGGQLVQRYAALNHADDKVRAAGIELRYVIGNPSSYLYFTNERPQGERFAPPDGAACPGFNNYKYGFEKIVRYAAHDTPVDSFKALAARDVIYMLGTADTNPNHRVLDKSCAAEAQGPNRLERGRAYVRYERHLAAGQITLRHHAYEVIGVGHNPEKMFGSRCGLQAVFGVSNPRDSDGAQCVDTTFAPRD